MTNCFPLRSQTRLSSLFNTEMKDTANERKQEKAIKAIAFRKEDIKLHFLPPKMIIVVYLKKIF